MIVELRFLTGRFHATPWGRHVNEAVPEWPPSPFRLLRALIDVWHRKHSELTADVVTRLLSALSAPPRFALPPARASHTRSYLMQGSEDPSDKKLIFDGFAVVDRDSAIVVGWPGAALDAVAIRAAQQLFGSLNYLGRSESWVEARVLDDREVAWNCVPLEAEPVAPRCQVVPVAGVVAPTAFEARGFEVPARGKTKARRLDWLEALTWGSSEAIAYALNRPPALEPLLYVRASDALDARPAPMRRTFNRTVEVVRFAVDGRVPAPITDALRVAEGVRRNLMGSHKRLTSETDLSPRFSGKDRNGAPLRDHSHVSILPLDEDRDGFIDALLIVGTAAFDASELHALDRILPVHRRNGHALVLTPVQYGSRNALLFPTTTVESHTPFAPNRHWRLTRDNQEAAWIANQIAIEVARRKLPSITAVARIPPPHYTRRRARWLDFQRARKDDAPQPAYGLRLEFAAPVLAPLSLGYASHFGLGCFTPAQ